jgi:hypothetical protein
MQDEPCAVSSSASGTAEGNGSRVELIAYNDTPRPIQQKSKYEVIKNVYRGCLLTVTVIMCLCIFKLGCEIATLNQTVARTRIAAERAAGAAQEYGDKILTQVEDLKKHGLKIRLF